MARTILLGAVAVVAVLAVLGTVFAVGALRIRMADKGETAFVPHKEAPTTGPAQTQPIYADDAPPPLPKAEFDVIELTAEKAKLSSGLTLETEKVATVSKERSKKRVGPPDPPPVPRQMITGWHSDTESAEWTATITKPAFFEVDLVCGASYELVGGTDFVIELGDQKIDGTILKSKGHSSFRVVTAGNLTLAAGQITVRLRLIGKAHKLPLRVRSIRLIPAS